MDASSTVVKSKSSNSGIISKAYKKSSSNAEFQRIVVKKRGVYVEKKTVDLGLKESEAHTKHDKLANSPPLRVDKRTLVSSKLKVQSKTTTGTQHPDTLNRDRKKQVRTRTEKTAEDNNIKKKNKFRSKALNKDAGKDNKEQPVIVFQSQRDLAQTPSIFSENDSIKPHLFSTKKAELINDDLDKMGVNLINNLIAKEIMEGKLPKKEKRVRIDELLTLVSGIGTDSNKGLYNFFVDFLETTISAYNDKAEEKHHDQSNAASSAKIPLEIDESVAKRLNIKNILCDCTENQEDTCNTARFCCLNDDDLGNNLHNIELNELQKTKTKRLKAKSFSFLPKDKRMTSEKAKDKIMTSESLVEKKKKNRKQRKETLLNLFKEQLKMGYTFREPQNLYQALKIMAQNKRCRNHFEERLGRKETDFGFPECMYRTRKVISIGKTKKKVTHENVSESKEGLNNEYRKKSAESNYSLKVTGYKYENSSVVKHDGKHRDLTFTYHSTPSISEDDFVEDSESDLYDSTSIDLLKVHP